MYETLQKSCMGMWKQLHVHKFLNSLNNYFGNSQKFTFLCPSLKKEGHIALHMSVCMSVCWSIGMSVSLNLVQLITKECFAQEASNLVGR